MKDSKLVYPGIDFTKLIAALMIVMIHTHPGHEFGRIGSYIYNVIPVWGVPFFFCCSGFFLCRQLSEKKIPVKQLKRLFILYILWTVIYLPFSINEISNGNLSIKGYVLDIILYGSVFHLWYIPALMISLTLVALIRNDKTLLIVSSITFIIGALGSSYYWLGMKIAYLADFFLEFNAYDKFRRIFAIGLPFTFLGYSIGKYFNRIKPFIATRARTLLCASIILFLLEIVSVHYFQLQRDLFISLSLPFLVMMIFVNGLSISLGKNTKLLQERGYIARSVSNCIYFSHPLCIFFISILLQNTFFGNNSISICISTYILSASLGYAIIKINNPLLNKLIQ